MGHKLNLENLSVQKKVKTSSETRAERPALNLWEGRPPGRGERVDLTIKGTSTARTELASAKTFHLPNDRGQARSQSQGLEGRRWGGSFAGRVLVTEKTERGRGRTCPEENPRLDVINSLKGFSLQGGKID